MNILVELVYRLCTVVGIFWFLKQMTTMIGFYDVSEMRKSNFCEMRYLQFFGGK